MYFSTEKKSVEPYSRDPPRKDSFRIRQSIARWSRTVQT